MIEAVQLTANWVQYFAAIFGASVMFVAFMNVIFIAIKRTIK